MAIKSHTNQKPTIDLNGPDGNVFALIGHARSLGKQLGFSAEKAKGLREEMMSGGYQNAIEAFDREFGDYVDLIK